MTKQLCSLVVDLFRSCVPLFVVSLTVLHVYTCQCGRDGPLGTRIQTHSHSHGRRHTRDIHTQTHTRESQRLRCELLIQIRYSYEYFPSNQPTRNLEDQHENYRFPCSKSIPIDFCFNFSLAICSLRWYTCSFVNQGCEVCGCACYYVRQHTFLKC